MTVLKVEIKSRDIIKPSSPTPDHCKTLQMCFIDQFVPPFYTPFIHFYDNPLSESDYAQKMMLLKRSLSETLTQFYPLAGKVEGNLSIDCNDQGVEFCEANVLAKLSDVVENLNPDELLNLLPFSPVTTEKSVITAVQVNRFLCNSVAISVLILHKIGDGATDTAFVDAWATKTRGIAENDCVPVQIQAKFDAALQLPPKDVSLFDGIEKLMTNEKLVTRRLVFNKEKLDMLKKQSTDESTIKPPSRVEVVSAYLWKKFIEAAREKPQPPKICYASQAVNLRTIPSSPIPKNCYGNLFWLGFANALVDEDVEYSVMTGKLRAAVRQIDVSYLEKFKTGECLDEIKNICESSLKGVSETCIFSSWTRFPLYEADFGWGKPIWVSMATLPLKNSAFFFNTKCGEGIEAWVNLSEKDVSFFEQENDFVPLTLTKV